jgi:RNA polymerase sigma-70 factor (ECF subfamily)
MVPEQAREIVTTVFDAWARPLLRYAICYTRNRAVAEELVQEAFLALFHTLISGTSVGNPRAWTLTVVRHLISKHHRDSLRESSKLADYGRLPAPSPAIEAHLAALESLRDAMEVLSEREEQVLLLRIESLRYDEIARELGVTSGTVATLLSRAILKIRKLREESTEKAPASEKRRLLERRSLQ